MRRNARRAMLSAGKYFHRVFACAFFGLLSSAAFAADGSQVQLEIRGRIEPSCGFTDVPQDADLGVLHQGQTIEIGTLAFRCNLADSANVTLSVQSENGGLKRDGGDEKVAYAASWSVQGNGGNFVETSSLASPVQFTLSSGSPGASEGGAYKLKITGPTDALLAGTYRDKIIYTISP